MLGQHWGLSGRGIGVELAPKCLHGPKLPGMRGAVQDDAASTAPWHARIVRRRPVPGPERHLHAGQVERLCRGMNGAPGRLVVGMTIIAPCGENYIVWLKIFR
jgi:hypothetical protein